jgi:PAS domain S-box-containing protein
MRAGGGVPGSRLLSACSQAGYLDTPKKEARITQIESNYLWRYQVVDRKLVDQLPLEKQSWKIMLVEDDEDDYLIVRMYLSEAKESTYEVIWVTNISEALENMGKVDAILVDYDLGKSSGLEVIQAAMEHGCKAPFILLTGQGSYDLDLAAMQAGAADFLTKGEVTPILLERSIRYAIEQKRTEEALRQIREQLEQRVTERTQELWEAYHRLEQTNQELRAEIRERERAEAQLAYQAYLIENVNDAIIAADEQLILTSWNQAAEAIFGWRAEEVLGRPALEFLELPIGKTGVEKFLNRLAESDYIHGEAAHYRSDGSLVYLEYRLSALKDEHGQVMGIVSVNRDVTRRHEMEAELAEVNRRLMDGREAERLHLSQELHDGPIQNLYGLTFQLAQMKNNAIIASDQFDSAKETAVQVIDVLRVICGDLRPPTLVPYGLEQTIRSHAERFQDQNSSIKVRLALMPDRKTLPEGVRLALFRIYQQAMANIARHSQATEVDVSFKLENDRVVMEVRDNGVGFDVPDGWIDLVREGHLGLAGSAERAEAIGGSMDVQSSRGEGTVITVQIPYNGVPKENKTAS